MLSTSVITSERRTTAPRPSGMGLRSRNINMSIAPLDGRLDRGRLDGVVLVADEDLERAEVEVEERPVRRDPVENVVDVRQQVQGLVQTCRVAVERARHCVESREGRRQWSTHVGEQRSEDAGQLGDVTERRPDRLTVGRKSADQGTQLADRLAKL